MNKLRCVNCIHAHEKMVNSPCTGGYDNIHKFNFIPKTEPPQKQILEGNFKVELFSAILCLMSLRSFKETLKTF